MATLFETAESILESIGNPLDVSNWVEVTQERINLFADATDDHQWIHVDAAKAKDGPFGSCIAHGYLTLSLASRFLPEIVDVRMKMGVNYGCDKVRFPAPVKVGSRIRGRGDLIAAERTKDGGVQATIRVTVEIEGEAKPACIADTISRYYF
ncbi:MaoC family dehydratase [Solimonas sp. SE-A11]|uniref:MaoC family dehydratase n=1 Tax=Solimonas sp. SE-A11 TaxID=3054954 RepID=UPI00259D1CCD|nr:MaoC family dehydratase [Solimonas sp. SE-A11]MDM4770714.1 MaoC family dehydratase [Solimonas sp. SE-A11]